jgi:ABC-2 type transport system permease protein
VSGAGRLAPPGSFAWLALHEIKLAWRSRSKRGATRWIGYAMILVWFGFGCFLGWTLRNHTIPEFGWLKTAVLAGSIVAFSFMTAQAMIGSQRTLYETGDLALLFSAPIDGRTVLLAKLLGITGSVALTYALLLLTIVVPIAALGHPQLFGVVALLCALALAAASIGIAITLGLAMLAGPRAARTVGQIAAAVLGGAMFLISQILSHSDRRQSSMVEVFKELRAHGVGNSGLSALPGRAALGDPLAILVMLGTGIVLFVLAGATLRRLFLSGYQDGGVRLSRARPTGRRIARLFHAGLFRSIFAKEWRLLARDPALAFQIVLRLVYLAPLVFVAFGGHGRQVTLAPGLAFASVLIASQLAGSFAWLTVSAEDAPDLLMVSPVAKDEVDLAKLLAALAMTAPLAMILPIAIAFQTIPGAIVTLTCTTIGGGLAALVELRLGKPGKRSSFRRRRSGSMVATILSMLIAGAFGGAAAVGVVFLG